jgi:hypothetical protein
MTSLPQLQLDFMPMHRPGMMALQFEPPSLRPSFLDIP